MLFRSLLVDVCGWVIGYSGPFFPLCMAREVSISRPMIIEGSIPAQAACSKKNEEGAIPDAELGSVMRIRQSRR